MSAAVSDGAMRSPLSGRRCGSFAHSAMNGTRGNTIRLGALVLEDHPDRYVDSGPSSESEGRFPRGNLLSPVRQPNHPGDRPMRSDTENAEHTTGRHGAGLQLGLATGVFVLTFWAWNLIGPLSKTYSERLDLGPTWTAVLVAFPVLVGAVGRIPVGIWTDRYGGRRMFTLICLASVVPTAAVGVSGGSYAAMLVSGV